MRKKKGQKKTKNKKHKKKTGNAPNKDTSNCLRLTIKKKNTLLSKKEKKGEKR